MFSKILVPTDFSEGNCIAIENFEKMNRMQVGEVVLLHVIDEVKLEEVMNGYSFFYNDEMKELKDIEAKLKAEAMKKLESRVEAIKQSFKTDNVKPMVKIGIPWKEIVKTADEEDVSLIMLPSHGRLGFTHEFMGSTTIRVLKKTTKPVLIIKTAKEVKE